jgi:hypothetical protein
VTSTSASKCLRSWRTRCPTTPQVGHACPIGEANSRSWRVGDAWQAACWWRSEPTCQGGEEMAAAVESRYGRNHERPPRGLPRAPLPTWRPTLGRGNVRTYQNVVERASPLAEAPGSACGTCRNAREGWSRSARYRRETCRSRGLGALALDPPGGSTSATSRDATGGTCRGGARAAGVAR